MAEDRITSKAELLAEAERAWNALHAALARLTPEQMTSIRDDHGWAVKDHIAHMTAWARAMLYFFQGKPRHEGLGVAENLYLRGDEDEINAAIYESRKDHPLETLLADFRATHRQLLDQIQPLTDADLHKPYRHYLPDEPGEGDGPPAILLLYNNTANHFRAHLGWIESLVDTQP